MQIVAESPTGESVQVWVGVCDMRACAKFVQVAVARVRSVLCWISTVQKYGHTSDRAVYRVSTQNAVACSFNTNWAVSASTNDKVNVILRSCTSNGKF